MTVKNKYINRSHISEKKFREILKSFVKDFTVTETTTLHILFVLHVLFAEADVFIVSLFLFF
jgi:hypothetical protein